MERIRRAGIVIVVTLLAFVCTLGAAEPPATVPTSQPVVAGADWPQWRGPNRDGIAVNSPKLLDAWPKDGPPLVWKSELVPGYRDGGSGGVVMADGKVFVYANKKPIDGGDSFRFVTAEILNTWGWRADLPEDLAKQIDAVWASKARPNSDDWPWWDVERDTNDGRKAFLEKKPELAKYITDFIATLSPADALKYGDYITKRLCIGMPMNKHMRHDGLNWEQLVNLSKLKDVGHRSCVDWEGALRGCGNFSITHHIGSSPNFATLWKRSFVWSDTAYCLDAATGKTLWKKSFPVDKKTLVNKRIGNEHGPFVQWWEFDNLGVSATPVAWGGKCYVVGSAGLYCLSAKDGSLLWKVVSGPEHATPLVEDGIVYHLGVAYDADTGKVLWKNPLWELFDGKHTCNEAESRYSSPVLWVSGGKKYVLTSDGKEKTVMSVVCLELQTGKVCWTLRCYPGFTATGSVYGDVLLEGMQENVPLVHAFHMTPTGTELLWKARSWVGGLLYQGHLFGGVCARLTTGEVTWKMADGFGAGILADGKMFGSISKEYAPEHVPFAMYRATPERYVKLGQFDPQIIPYSPSPIAIARGKLFVRAKDCIACYDLEDHGLYYEGVAVTKDTLTFRFKQSGGGLAGNLKDVLITAADGAPVPAKAQLSGENIVVDIRDVPLPFAVSCAASTALTGKNGKPVPSFEWSESRLLRFRKGIEKDVYLTSALPLQQAGAWDQIATYAIAGAKVTGVKLDPRGKGVRLTTDKTWKAGDDFKLTYPCFAVDQGAARFETLTAKVVEVQRAAAQFIKTDTTTGGDWQGKYGSQGAMVAGDGNKSEAPRCATVGLRNCSDLTPWALKATDPSCLQKTGKNGGRSNVIWDAGDQLFIDIEFTDGKEHQVAMNVYSSIREQSVEILDADTQAVLDTQSIPKDTPNKYLVWNLKGSATLRGVNLGSAESAGVRVGGVFFDPPAPATQPGK